VTHPYNPSYSGGRDQEDHILKPALANLKKKKKSQKMTGILAQGIGPEFKPQYHEKEKEIEKTSQQTKN
jgi:hypothetical protein